jgi:sulfatase modifying factor 1
MLLIAVGCDDSSEITNTIGMKLNKIPAGTFMMGSPETEKDRQDDEYQHKVSISKPFYIQTTEVTQGQWKAVMGTEPWKGKQYVKEGLNYAASYVSWDDAVAYCKKLSEIEDKTYRLPTEAEWEYACRAGTETAWSFGNDEKAFGDYAWYDENTYDIGEEYAHEVGQKKPNAFGLYDMHGNVYEWCHDSYEEDYYKQSPEKDPQGPTSGDLRVCRGRPRGFVFRLPRSAVRGMGGAFWGDSKLGFRLVRELDDSEPLRTQAAAITAAITAAIGKGDWETVLALDPDNEAGTKLKAAAVAAALATGDWKAVLALDATNSEGLRMQAAFTEKAVAAALVKGDWKEVLALDATNSEGLRMQAHELAPITNTIGMKFNKIPAGTFTMGSPEGEEGRRDIETQHKVTISKPFYMQTTEVTQEQWKEVMGTEPWKGKSYVKAGPNYAASYVSWNDALEYCKKLSEKEGKTYRLPTEAEWEYACRSGTKTRWSFGDDEKALGDYAWYQENAWDIDEKYAHQVELKKPNAFGLYDMHGNVFEWCHDYYEEDYYKQSPAKDPTGPTSGYFHVLRGNSWNQYTRDTRSAVRSRDGSVHRRSPSYGFRLVRELD